MKDQNKLFSIASAATSLILFLILVSSAASAAPLNITETRITTSGSAYDPDIYEDKIVYARDGNISMYDLFTTKETKIKTEDESSAYSYPSIYGNKIVFSWVSKFEPEYGVEMYDLSTHNGRGIGQFSNSNKHPAIYGSRIVWDDFYIYMYDLSNDTETQISSNGPGYYPAIYKDKIVWDNGSNIYMYDIPTKQEAKITTSRSAGYPRIYGDKIVWEDHRDSDSSADIYMYDLSTQKETLIAKNGFAPDIYEDKIVWTDGIWTDGNIYMYDLFTDTKTQITTSGSASSPAIYGNRIVWSDGRSGISDIYMATFNYSNPLVASFSASPDSGYAPLEVQFTDKSRGNPTSWNWSFGDGNTSFEQSPVHTYYAAGTYTVNLTVSNVNGTDSKLAKITVLKKPVSGIQFAYITNSQSHNVSIIDTATNTVTATVPVGNNPEGVAVTPDGKVYVANQGSNTVSVIDMLTNNVIATVPLGNTTTGITGIAVNPMGTKVYVTNYNEHTVSVIDIATNTVSAIVHAGNYPHGVAVNPDGTKVYVTHYWNKAVSVIDTATNTVTATITVGNKPAGVAVSSNGKRIYVTNYGSNNVSVIEAATNTVLDTVPIGNGPSGVTVTPDETKVYVTSRYSYTVSVIDTATNTITATINVGSNPYGVAVSPDGKEVYVANQGSNTVSVIDTANNNVIATVPVGKTPSAFGQFIGSLPKKSPVADFICNVSSGIMPLTVSFTDTSTGFPTTWFWDFGDGTNSTEKNTTHTYSFAGNYTVNLTVSNMNGTDSKLSTIKVSAPVLPVFPGCTQASVDPNNDGLYEDINGNGRLDFADVVTYYNNMAWITQNSLAAYFDYNKNGRIDFNDVVKLYNMH